LGSLLFRQEKYQEALRMFKNVDITHKNVAKIVSDIEKQLQNDAQDHYRKGVEYFLAEQLDQAIKEWEETLRLHPDHRDAKRDLQKTRRLLENLRKLP
jgi:tetratricopeptide (TPR) repeat protein